MFFQLYILKWYKLYNVFESEVKHAIYAQFMVQSALSNQGKPVGIFRVSGTWFALWFYAMRQFLCLKIPLKATIHQQVFVTLIWMPVQKPPWKTLKMVKFWKSMYILLCAVFPALMALCYWDMSKPSMDKIFSSCTRQHKQLKCQKSSWTMQNSLEVWR